MDKEVATRIGQPRAALGQVDADDPAAFKHCFAEVNGIRMHLTERLNRAKGDAKDLQAQLDESLARELALLRQVFGLRKELAALRGGSVLPLQPR
ncbi:hypothetical protein WQE_38529 [Paraburkholderia hospita]|uniref:Uncharacterized protein n=1 Tax=Paraburkholderia hospita TaxID=169430 RepID=A0ABN0FAA8_9BURK|nr:hypothetical protein [Paraburkholderia hospita]EIM95618.1 hypothetical protein WQE_38529 [Paraburkholderia hospita]OUL70922.1 hypothetical protein CA602_47425 [Paraburkholderia hospita]